MSNTFWKWICEESGRSTGQVTRPDGSNGQQSHRADAGYRPLLIVLFAIAVALLTGIVHGQDNGLAADGVTAHYGALESHPTPGSEAVIDPDRHIGGAIAGGRVSRNARPSYVELFANLANFDADADPDGWRVEVILRDQNDRPVAMRAHATFELMPRLPTADFQNFVNARSLPIRWSQPLDFDDDKIARVRLPLRRSLETVLGWSSSLYRPDLADNRHYGRHLSLYGKRRTFVTNQLRASIAKPTHGQLKVRVSVPTEGVFEATAPVRVRPPVLVDTNWPYR